MVAILTNSITPVWFTATHHWLSFVIGFRFPEVRFLPWADGKGRALSVVNE